MVMCMHRHYVYSLFFLALAGCASGEVRETLGINRTAPDEFVIVSRPPLSVPPEFSLIPPDSETSAGNNSARATSSAETAREALLGGDKSISGTVPSDTLTSEFSSGTEGVRTAPAASLTPIATAPLATAAEAHFLSQVAADKADPEIRSKLKRDTRSDAPAKEESKSLYESVIGAEKNEPVVDATKEAKRLHDAKENGEKPNVGEVPTRNEQDGKSVLDRVF
jgi:hypothetical protein